MNRLHQNPSQPGKIEKPQNSALAVNRLLAYLSPFRLRLWIVFFFVVIYSLLGLAGPYLMGVAIDRYMVKKNVIGLEII